MLRNLSGGIFELVLKVKGQRFSIRPSAKGPGALSSAEGTGLVVR